MLLSPDAFRLSATPGSLGKWVEASRRRGSRHSQSIVSGQLFVFDEQLIDLAQRAVYALATDTSTMGCCRGLMAPRRNWLERPSAKRRVDRAAGAEFTEHLRAASAVGHLDAATKVIGAQQAPWSARRQGSLCTNWRSDRPTEARTLRCLDLPHWSVTAGLRPPLAGRRAPRG